MAPKSYPRLDYDKVAKHVTVEAYKWKDSEDRSCDQRLAELYEGIEYEMDQLAQAGDLEALIEASHGRAQGFHVRQRQVQPKARNGDPKSCPQAQRWRSVARMLRSLYVLYFAGKIHEAMEMAFRIYTGAQALGHSKMIVLGHARKMLCVFNEAIVEASEELAHRCDHMADAMQRYDSA